MDDLQDKLGAILSNPQMMQQIMSMAQALGQSQNEPPRQESQPQPGIDVAAFQKITGLVGKSGIDKNQQNLLRALGPYLCRERISKLEKAMRAAKIAGMASAFLGSGGQSSQTGR